MFSLFRDLAEWIKDVVAFQRKVTFDESKPDGMPIKRLDTQELRYFEWRPMWSVEDALRKT